MTDFFFNLDAIVAAALKEDSVDRDITTEALIPGDALGEAAFRVKEDGVVAGLPVAETVFQKVDPELVFTVLVGDGHAVRDQDVVATVEGNLASILRAERVALNFVQHLSGIASETSRYVQKISGTGVRILDTRKTTPGLRWLEKYAVMKGGGTNHRFSLSDGLLVKDNHVKVLRARGFSLADIIRACMTKVTDGTFVEFEVTSVDEVDHAIAAGARMILLDNMTNEQMRKAVNLAKNAGCRTEASGGINLDRVRAVAKTGVDFISVGALTHSASALDISLEVVASAG